ncbi:hypothetical protein J1N35_014746 [Gossypium stocksii]|uniref:Uncharacterized protein n=1 Tax=Gossypium stocksii TaxID=47602 RepID=A0A9D3VUN4_9ROSI|nr:hypothetical protein J1N35_014746 [Gossypium stocksii]
MINLRRDFENLKMKEVEMVKQYADRIMAVISSLQDSRDLSTISLSELINALYALEQRRASKEKGHTEDVFQTRNKDVASSSNNEKNDWTEKKDDSWRDGGKEKNPPCSYCKKTNHLERSIVEAYHRCDLAVWEPTIFEEVAQENNIGACCKMVKKKCSKLANHVVASSRMKCKPTSLLKCRLQTQQKCVLIDVRVIKSANYKLNEMCAAKVQGHKNVSSSKHKLGSRQRCKPLDTLTKPLVKMMFEKLRYSIRVRSMEVKEECCEMTIHANCEL